MSKTFGPATLIASLTLLLATLIPLPAAAQWGGAMCRLDCEFYAGLAFCVDRGFQTNIIDCVEGYFEIRPGVWREGCLLTRDNQMPPICLFIQA